MKTVLQFVLCSLFLALPVWAQEVAPDSKTPTEEQAHFGERQDFLKTKKAFYLELHDEYERTTKDSPETRRAFVKLHRHYIDVSCKQPERISWAELYAEARDFQKLEPKDPISLIQTGRILTVSRRDEEVAKTVKMVEGAEARLATYSPYARLLGIGARSGIYNSQNASYKKRAAALNKQLKLLFAWMDQKDQPESVQRIMFEEAVWFLYEVDNLRSKQGANVRSKFLRAVNGSTELKPWLKNMLLGRCNSEIAWDHRGHGYSSTVTEDGWDGFKRHTQIAEGHFLKAYALKPNRPEPAASMITIAMTNDTESNEATWFDRATTAELDYPNAYTKYAATLLPQWGGSHDEMIEFGRTCRDSNRYDTLVPFRLCSVIQSVKSNFKYDTDELIKLHQEMQQVCNNYEKFLSEEGYSPLPERKYHRAFEFGLAIEWKLWERAKQVFQKYNGDVFCAEAEKKFQFDFKQMSSFAFAMSGDESEIVESIHQRMESGLTWHKRTEEQSEQLMRDIQQAKMSDGTAEAEPYLLLKQELVEKQLEFHQGDWVDLEFTEDLRHWENFGGKFKVEGPKSILSYSVKGGNQYISYQTSFPPPYELEVTVEFIEATPKHLKYLYAGLTCGRMYGPRNGRLFWFDGVRGYTGVAGPGPLPLGVEVPDAGKINRLNVHVFNGYYEHSVLEKQDALVFARDEKFEPGRVGLAIIPWYIANGKVRYKNMRVRKLYVEPPPPVEESAACVEYYLNRLETQNIFPFHMELAAALKALGKPEEAIESYRNAGKLRPASYTPLLKEGFLHFEQKKYEAALKAHQAALEKCGSSKYSRRVVLGALIGVTGACPDESARDGKQAVKYATVLLSLERKKRQTWQMLNMASIAYAEDQQFKKAIELCEQGLKKAKTDEAREILNEKIELYEQEKAFRYE